MLFRSFPAFPKAYEYMAKVYLDLDYREELKKLCADAEKNGVKSVILDAYLFQLDHKQMSVDELNKNLKNFRQKIRKPLEDGREEYYEKGLPILTEYLYHYPDSYMLNERGIFHRTGRHNEEARSDIEKALSLNPANAYALHALSFVYKYMGNYEKALFYIKKAILYMDEEKSRTIYTDMGNLYALLGDFELALAGYRQYEQELEGRTEYWHLGNMAEFHAQLGNVESAGELYKKEYEQGGKDLAKYYERLTGLYMGSGLEDRTRQILELWARDLRIDRRGSLWGRVRRKLFPNNEEFKRQMWDACVFFQNEAWTELVFGRPEAALKAFDRMALCMAQDGGEGEYRLSDAVFAAILCGDESRGREYVKRLRELLEKKKASGVTPFYNSQKAYGQREFLINYYDRSDEELQEILDRGESREICHFCTNPVCKELEGARVLLLLRQGRREEAAARIKRNMERQLWDEYMRAARHVAFGDQV